jgi:hypothetical protein
MSVHPNVMMMAPAVVSRDPHVLVWPYVIGWTVDVIRPVADGYSDCHRSVSRGYDSAGAKQHSYKDG